MEEPFNTLYRFIPARTILYAAGAGLAVGILLTVAVSHILSTTPERQPPALDVPTSSTFIIPKVCQSSQSTSNKTFEIFEEEKKNWFEALADCHKRGMLFAAIENEEEYIEVLRLISNENSDNGDVRRGFWLSGTDIGSNGTYVWMSTGHNVTFNRWNLNEENQIQEPTHGNFCGDGQEHCMELLQGYHYQMNDNCCHDIKGYVCMTVECSS